MGWFQSFNSSKSAKTDEMRHNAWCNLEIMWFSVRPENSANDRIIEIDTLIAEGKTTDSARNNWAKFNETELKVGSFMTQPHLRVAFESLLYNAMTPRLASFETHKARLTEMQSNEPAALLSQRAAYQTLLAELQSAFISRRYMRYLRGSSVWLLLQIMLCAAVAAILSVVVMEWMSRPVCSKCIALSHTTRLILPVVAFGALGASFSRALSFQRAINSLSFDAVMESYVRGVLWLRLAFGAVGALVLFLFMQSGALTGVLFPHLEMDPDLKDGSAQNLALLLLWSFIAGFSEILVPDTLARLEKRPVSNSTPTPPPAPTPPPTPN